ncbi:hypothetical protein [Natranaerobius trueperi]|uniref:Uncharacterized protein n=1 Tax=Natranaerobius trueperi TaxID=759412 RepID=A0A226C062_9FIRM|nr:hypothetical protein [Natranaerobius trueperi]OWZ83760.1 hypothetical protein CDO51_06610 [Natranaerobius trueperi]
MFFNIKKTDKIAAIKDVIEEHLEIEKQKIILEWLDRKIANYACENTLCYHCLTKMKYGGYIIDKKSKRRSDGKLEKVPSYLFCPKCSYKEHL